MKKGSFQFSRYPIIKEHWVVKSKVINIYITQGIYCKKYAVEKGFLDNTDPSFARVQGQVKEKIKGSYRDISASGHSTMTKYLRNAHWKHKSELEELLKKTKNRHQRTAKTVEGVCEGERQWGRCQSRHLLGFGAAPA